MSLQNPSRRQPQSFNEFIIPRLEDLRDELIQECEKIARLREQPLKLEIERVQNLNKVLRHKLLGIPGSGDVDSIEALYSGDIEGPAAREYSSTSSTNGFNGPGPSDAVCQDEGDIQGLGTNDSAAINVDIDGSGPVKDSSRSASLTTEDCDFHLWPEWQKQQPLYRSQIVKSGISGTVGTNGSDWLRGHSILTSRHQESKSCGTVFPNSCLALAWDFIGIPILLYDLITLPLQVFWEHQGEAAIVIMWVVISYWTLDIFLRLFVIGFLTPTGKVRMIRKDIMMNYVKRHMLFDLIMVVPDWISMLSAAPRRLAFFRVFRTMRFIRVLRISKLRQTTRLLQDLMDSEYFSIYMNVTWNSLIILGCCHYIACLWYWVAQQGARNGYKTWMQRYMPTGEANVIYDWQNKYLTSLHWALCQFTPGSIAVQPSDNNNVERGYAIIVLIWGMVFFSLFLSSITQERMRMRALTKKMERDNWLLRRYMRQHGVSREFSLRAVQYVDAFVAPMLMRVQRKDVALLDCLSRPLQVELQTEIYFHTLQANPFCANLKEKGAHMAATLFSSVVLESALAKYDLLFEVGQVSHEMFFVSTGVIVYFKHDTRSLSSLQPSDWCCEQIIWVPWVHKGTCRAAGESHLLSVDSAKFRRAVLEYRERGYVCNCAKAYLEDLSRLTSSGIEVDDLHHMDEHDSEYVKAFTADIEENLSFRSGAQ